MISRGKQAENVNNTSPMEFLIEFLKEVIFVFIFRYPGAFVRWIFVRRRRNFRSVLQDDGYVNATVTVLIVGVGVIVYNVFRS